MIRILDISFVNRLNLKSHLNTSQPDSRKPSHQHLPKLLHPNRQRYMTILIKLTEYIVGWALLWLDDVIV